MDASPIKAVSTQSWRLNSTVVKDLANFDGRPLSYRMRGWRMNVRLASRYQAWGSLLECVERARVPLTFKRPSECPSIDGVAPDPNWLFRNLWTLTGNRSGGGVTLVASKWLAVSGAQCWHYGGASSLRTEGLHNTLPGHA